MKKNITSVILLFILILSSCVNEIDSTVVSNYIGRNLTVRASTGESQTKTAVQSNGTSIYWTPGDAINVFYGSGSAGKFTATSLNAPNSYAEFNGTISVVTGSNETGGGSRKFWGVYPYNESNTCDGSSITMTIPSSQAAAAETFANNLNPTVSCSPGLDMVFYNVGSWFIFSVTQEGVVSATLTGNNDEDLVGKVKVTMDSNNRPACTILEGEKSITMDAPEGGFVPGVLYYMVLIPQTLEQGYTLTLKKTNAQASCVISTSAQFTRSNYRRKKNADEGLTYTPVEGAIPPNNEIWYTSTNNNVVVPYAGCDWISRGMIVSNTYADGKGVIVFSSDISEIPSSAFRNSMPAGPLSSITLPNSVTRIQTKAFYNNSALECVNNVEHLTSIDDYAFYRCQSLQRFTIPASLTSLGVNVFTDCYSLEELTIKSTSTFHAYGLAYLVNGANIRTLNGPFATDDHKFIIINNELVMAAGKESGNIIIPESVTTVKPYVFYSFKDARTITVPSGVSSFGIYAFYGCTGLEIINLLSQTPASVAASFDNTNECPIIVPSGSVNSYKEAWSNYSTRIAASVDDLPIFLSSSGTANSYLVNNAGNYSIMASHRGNSTKDEDVINGAQAIVLWESQFGYDTFQYDYEQEEYFRVHHPFHDVGSVVTDVEYQEHKIFFTATGNEGNALIALTSNNGAVIWSWHIWVRKNVGEITCPNGKVIMSCNLGAIGDDVFRETVTSTHPYYWGETGLLYQWGRKDPFVGNDTSLWATETRDGYLYNYANSHPTTYLVPTNSEYTLGGWSSSQKTITDPCPPGWLIPSSSCWPMSNSGYLEGYGQYDNSGNIYVLYETKDWGHSRYGFLNPYIYNNIYSQPGYITDSGLKNYKSSGRYWCYDSDNAGFFELSTTGYSEDDDAILYYGVRSGVSNRHYAQSVRCCKE